MKSLIYLRAAGFAVALAACGGRQPENVKTAEMANADSTAPSKQDSEFMVKAASGEHLEVVLGHLAESNGANPGVKRFGEMMVQEHSQGEETFRGLAALKRITLPDTLSVQLEEERAKLEKKHGAAFDKAYVKMMVDGHKEDISEYQHAAINGNDPDIKALAAANIPILQMQLDSVQDLTMVVGK
ncbi:DUF4142 domain-containing protein [Puia sp.]|jgi:putative membrane protein|uniref:DUF4142 domain-containing protein n=1 Tax=Puia sp. TaxID=2045100 RepID=UPI002F414110